MRNRTRYIISRTILILYSAGLCLCCFWDFRSSIDVSHSLLGLPADKVTHFLLFLPLPVISYAAFPQFRSTPERFLKFMAATFMVGAAAGGGIEIIQGLTGYRSCDKMDFVADCCGLAVSALTIANYEIFIRRRRTAR